MTDYVVDTDVISFFLRHDSRAEPYRPYLEGVRPVISLMTLAECSTERQGPDGVQLEQNRC